MASLEESASDSFIGSSSGGAFLVPKFQIGSIHGKSHYSIEERVFHDDDIPQRAVELLPTCPFSCLSKIKHLLFDA